MKTAAKTMIVAGALFVSGGLLAMNYMSSSSTEAAVASVDRFAGTSNYCQVFAGAQGAGRDGISADYSAALGNAIHNNGDDTARTYSMIREKCKVTA